MDLPGCKKRIKIDVIASSRFHRNDNLRKILTMRCGGFNNFLKAIGIGGVGSEEELIFFGINAGNRKQFF
jgi:hypothetical protein